MMPLSGGSNVESETGVSIARRDVGVAVALRRAQRQQQQQHAQPHSQSRQRTKSTQNKRRRQHPRRPRCWWHDLGIGLSLYLTCIYLPTFYNSLSYLYNYIWCPLAKSFCKELLGGDAAWTDVGIIFVVSLSLAMIRIAVIQRLVDMPSPHHVEAMVRCKSIHLLSSAYPQSLTPTQAPRSTDINMNGTKRQHEHMFGANFDLAPPLPSLTGGEDRDHVPTHTDNTLEQRQEQPPLSTIAKANLQPRVQRSMSMPQGSSMKKSPSWVESTWETVRRSSQKALIVHDNNNPRLHAAPRYATAAFRCLYSAFSLITAWFCFSHSNIWPPAVLGHGATSNCWNLKGSLGMAEDFDGLDALLKLYYLLQASYHVHSGAFHILTMVLLWTRRQRYPGDNNSIKINNNKVRTKQRQDRASAKPFTAYWRSLLQHCIALLLIGGSHLFASTRRLGAIGSFALDASSLSLHLLQLCINAPMTIPPIYIKIFHRGLVIPLFVYCRFYVWPFVVWRSAMFESKEWLQQMESTLFPGIYRAMMYVFTGLTVILLGLNLVLFRRLVNHPHLQRVYRNHHHDLDDNSNKRMVVQQ